MSQRSRLIVKETSALQKTHLTPRLRQLSRGLSRNTLGVFISAALSIFMPWSLLSMGISARSLWKHVKQFSALTKELASAKIRVSKEVIFEGLIQGGIEKLCTTILLFGHDELVLGTDFFQDFFSKVGKWIGDHSDTVLEAPNFQPLVEADKVNRMSIGIIEEASSVASVPTEATQKALALATADGLHSAGIHSGWSLPGDQVLKQVVEVGAVHAGTEMFADKVLEDPADRTLDAVHGRTKKRSGSERQAHGP